MWKDSRVREKEEKTKEKCASRVYQLDIAEFKLQPRVKRWLKTQRNIQVNHFSIAIGRAANKVVAVRG